MRSGCGSASDGKCVNLLKLSRPPKADIRLSEGGPFELVMLLVFLEEAVRQEDKIQYTTTDSYD